MLNISPSAGARAGKDHIYKDYLLIHLDLANSSGFVHFRAL